MNMENKIVGIPLPFFPGALFRHSQIFAAAQRKIFLTYGRRLVIHGVDVYRSEEREKQKMKTLRSYFYRAVAWAGMMDLNGELYSAAINGQVAKIQLLLDAGADIHSGETSSDNDMALRFAAEAGQVNAVQVLLEAGADVHANDDEALRWAAAEGHTETVKILLEAGADMHVWDDEPLREAASNGRTATVRLLLKAGADVQTSDALLMAALRGHPETVHALLEPGADVQAQYDEALWWAETNGQTGTVRILKEWMAREKQGPASDANGGNTWGPETAPRP